MLKPAILVGPLEELFFKPINIIRQRAILDFRDWHIRVRQTKANNQCFFVFSRREKKKDCAFGLITKDNEEIHGHSTLLLKPVCKSLINPLEMGELNSENEMAEDKQRMISGIKTQNYEKVDQAVIKEQNENRVGNIPKLLNFSDRDDILNGRKGNKMEDSVETHTIPSTEVKLSEKGEYYTDKSVVDYEVPEQIACNLVKDICIDEELPFLDKILIEHGERTLSFQPTCLSSTEVSRKSDDSLQLISDEMKSLVGHYHDMGISSHFGSRNSSYKSEEHINSEDVGHNEKNPLDEHIHDENVSPQCHSSNQSRKGEANRDAKDEIPYDMPDERVQPENFDLLHNWENENSQPDSYPLKTDIVQQHSEQEQLCSVENLSQKNEEKIEADDGVTKGVSSDVLPTNVVLLQKPEVANSRSALSNFNGNEDEQQFQQDINNKLVASYTAVCSASKQPSARPPFDCNVERGSITFNFDFPKMSNKEEIPHYGRLQTLPGGLQEWTVDDLTTSSRSFSMQDGPRESSFSAVGPLSGPISYSGPVPFSGSISLRSDSSTTSTRSFAFPILHAESNGSPVKMAKPDRRHFRKHRGNEVVGARKIMMSLILKISTSILLQFYSSQVI